MAGEFKYLRSEVEHLGHCLQQTWSWNMLPSAATWRMWARETTPQDEDPTYLQCLEFADEMECDFWAGEHLP